MVFVLTAVLLCSLLPGRECILCDLESVPEPRNGDRKCNEKKCVLTCEDNYFFYYEATSSFDVTCTPSGKWNITRRTPDCIALADKEHHVVVAPFGYTGPSQQIDIDVCQIYYMEYIVNQLNDLAVK
ncbi:hypothetical protein LSAT2_014160 [Lamellibrachia satsuma]|nr:hypothetical protein LSAT2_014160 [Lamellibrachia satsuma]